MKRPGCRRTGDLGYDQFIHHNGKLTLLDFDYFALAETSYDLGKFCAFPFLRYRAIGKSRSLRRRCASCFSALPRELGHMPRCERFAIYEALQLALRAMSFMWAQVPGEERMAEIPSWCLLLRGSESFSESIRPNSRVKESKDPRLVCRISFYKLCPKAPGFRPAGVTLTDP